MNEEISVTLNNNTNQVQPITLFTEIFNIPDNINSYGFWDVSEDSFEWGAATATAKIQIDTTPISFATPYVVTGALLTNDANGLVTALNALGQGIFSNNNNVISVVQQTNNLGQPFFYGTLLVSPTFSITVTSSVPNGIIPAIQLNIGVVINAFSIASGITTTQTPSYQNIEGEPITVLYSAGAGATSWAIIIQWYQANGVVTPLFINTGLGAVSSSYFFNYPQTGNIVINFSIV